MSFSCKVFTYFSISIQTWYFLQAEVITTQLYELFQVVYKMREHRKNTMKENMTSKQKQDNKSAKPLEPLQNKMLLGRCNEWCNHLNLMFMMIIFLMFHDSNLYGHTFLIKKRPVVYFIHAKLVLSLIPTNLWWNFSACGVDDITLTILRSFSFPFTCTNT